MKWFNCSTSQGASSNPSRTAQRLPAHMEPKEGNTVDIGDSQFKHSFCTVPAVSRSEKKKT